MDQLDLIDIYRTFHPKTMNFTFFSSTHGIFSRRDHILGHKSSLGKFKKIEIISSIFSDHNAVRLDVNYRKVKVKVAQLCPTLCNSMDFTVHRILQARILEWVAFPFSRDFPNLGIEPRCPKLQANSLPAEPQGSPKNTGVGSLSLLQWIILTQESNWGLLHCRWILYQLSYEGSHNVSQPFTNH